MAATVPAPIESKNPFPRGIQLLKPFICEQGEAKSLLLHPEQIGTRKPDYLTLLDRVYRWKRGLCPLGDDLLEDENTSMGDPPLEGKFCWYVGAHIRASIAAMEPDVKLSQDLGKGFAGDVTRYAVLSYPESDVLYGVNSAATVERVGLERPEMTSLLPGGVDACAEFVAFLDSGASVHVTGQKMMLKGYMRLTQPWKIAVPDGRLLDVVGVGSITTSGGSFNIPNVFYVEGLAKNLISVSQLDQYHGLFSGFHTRRCEIMKRDGEVIGGGFLQDNGQYKLRFLLVPEN